MKLLIMVALLVLLIGCAGTTTEEPVVETTAEETTDCMDKAMFDMEPGCLVIVDGMIYDFSEHQAWVDGLHAGKHACGQDHSQAINAAPHGRDVIEPYKLKPLCE